MLSECSIRMFVPSQSRAREKGKQKKRKKKKNVIWSCFVFETIFTRKDHHLFVKTASDGAGQNVQQERSSTANVPQLRAACWKGSKQLLARMLYDTGSESKSLRMHSALPAVNCFHRHEKIITEWWTLRREGAKTFVSALCKLSQSLKRSTN
jgi:hypothetical protein